ncbi:MAG TPA: selenoneine biosynthesis selenosugar synthase SenB [Burkholderiales bacterium]|nr:selenoneine biosynthesis selenosugar synthase SenB [Burkholderiales bacterium]
MKIALVTPAAAGSRHGNRHTAARWATFLRRLGHRVRMEQTWSGAPADLMIALHARRSHDSARRYKSMYPTRPLIVALTGTDLYRDITFDPDARKSLRIADRLVVLQDEAPKALSSSLRRKVRVIYQSAHPVKAPQAKKSAFELVVSGHLRAEKDPFRIAAALEHLPARSTIEVIHMGGAMSPEMMPEARAWMARAPRYRWIGEVSHREAARRLGQSRAMVISSRIEGGANVVSEALAAGVPVIASRIAGNIGMLGRGYAGYFPAGNERALARLLWRVESDPEFYRTLKRQCAARRALVDPRRERRALERLIAELAPSTRSRLPSQRPRSRVPARD